MSFSSSSRDGEFPLHGDKFKFVATFPASSENDPIFSVVAASPTVECLKEVWAQYCHQLTSPKSRDGDIASNFVAPFSKIALAAHVLLSVLRSSLMDTNKSNPAVGGSPLFARTEADLHRYQALRVVFTEFSQLCKSEPHTAAAMAGEESSLVLRAFYLAQSKLELRLMSTPILFRTATRPQSRVNSSMALTVAPFSTPRARVKPSSELQSGIRLSAIFGGQGPKYLEELRETFLSYPYTHSFLERINAVIEAELVSDECRKLPDGFYHHGLNFMTWLRAPSSASPPADYLASAPISFPMIGITQLCNFYAFAIASGQNVGGLVDKLHSITGHSQGLVSAVAVACSRSNQEFEDVACDMARFLFWCGARMEANAQGYRSHSVSLTMPDNMTDGATHMLSVRGLLPEELEKVTNVLVSKLETSGLLSVAYASVALINNTKSCVVSGIPDVLSMLQSELLRGSAKPTDDQSRIPFSKRKRSISTRFLRVTVPFHCSFNRSVCQQLREDVKRMGISISRDTLRLPVLSTLDGRDIRITPDKLVEEEMDNVFSLLIDLQAIHPVNWPLVTKRIVSAQTSHILAFGPGGSSNIASLTSNLVNGCGIRVLLCTAKSLHSVGPRVGDGTLTPADIFRRHPQNRLQSIAAALTVRDEADTLVVPPVMDWRHRFSPRLVRMKSSSVAKQWRIVSKWTRMLGTPPIMVAGMTPTSSYYGLDLVAAVCNAGYWGELAGGGLPRRAIFQERVDTLCSKLSPGVGFHLNILYLNQKQWKFQFPMALQMRKQGYPILSLIIAAGVPSLEKCTEIISKMIDAGMECVSFKPGSVASIKRVVEIARTFPNFKVVLQWSGGRAGGHHSFEDMHQPILKTYDIIRQQSNMILVAGSGFGDAKHSLPYLTGEWSESFGRPCMPFDAILLGSRMMVSKEASTSIEVKQMLVKTPGVKRQESWEKSYTGIAGGVITVKSELGEPIHKIHNRATALWRRLDTQFFSLKPEQRGPAIKANKDSIIAALNSDFQKPFFGRKGRGDNSQVAELWQMTYEEVAFRMAELMYVQPESERDDDRHENFHPEGRWVDPTFQSRLLKFLRRTMERFPPTNVETDKGPVEVSSSAISRRPAVLLKRFFVERPQACAHQLHSEDVDFFLHMCKFGGKPVNFIPVVDGELIYWFKKDSLWYSEDLAAVTGRDPQRVVVLQGPVAVKHSVSTTESASDILNGIRDGLVEMLHHQAPQVDRAAEPPNVPEEDDAGDRRAVWNECGLRVSTSADGMVSTYFALPGASRSCTYEEWVDFVTITNPESSTEQRQIDEGAMRHILAGKDNHYYAPTAWVHAALSAVDVVDRGNKWVQSPLRPLFRPPNIIRVQRKAVPQPTDSGDGTDSGTAVPPRLRVASVSVLDAKHQEITPEVMAEAKDFRTLCTLSCVPGADSDSPVELVLSLNYHYSAHHDVAAAPRKQTTLALALHFSLHGKSLCRVRTGENDRIKDFYAALWAPSGMSASSVADESEVEREHVSTFKLTADHLSSLVAALHGPSEAAGTAASTAPMDAFIVAAWEPLVKCLLPKQIDASLLELVHQSNSYRWVLPAGSDKTTRQPIEVDEEIHCTARIKEISNTESGKSVNVEALLSRTSSGGKKVPFAVVESAFLFRGKFTDSQNCFKRFRYSRSIVLHNETEVVILLDKSWISFNDPIKAGAHPPGVYAGAELLFELEVREYGLQGRGANASIAQCNVSGKAYNSRDPTVPIATIDYGAEKIHTNPVINFLDRRRAPGIRPNMFESGGQNMLAVPHETLAPSKGTPYGQSSGDLNPIHVSPQFASLATLPDTIVHGMWTYAAARRVVEKAVVRGQQQNLRSFSMDFVGMVMPGSKLYTQVKHVGMKDYSKVLEVTTVNSEGSVVLKGRAQTELEHTVYVFTGQGSAEKDMGMDLYRSSAVAKDIWDRADEHLLETYGFSILNIVRQNPTRLPLFFGGKRGQQVRANYRSLTCRDPVTGMRAQLIPEIGAYTDSFQFLNPQGLLFATQFTQPALVLTELAAFCDMREKGLVEKCGFSFAGHSLGEYAALSAACDILGLKSLVELVFLRGLTMQRAVPRDRLGRSDFGMVAASPTRIMKNFTEENLHELVNSISRQSKKLLQVVNYNVEGSQYVVAGHLVCLSALTEVCTALHLDRSRTLIKDLEGLVSRKLALAEKLQAEKKAVGGILTMKRGKATIPLAGIDVPFHSRYLASGVETFRFTMMQKITESRMTKERLQLMLGHYIPNVTAKPFSLSYEYVCLSHKMTGSKVLEALMPAVDDPEAEAKWTALTEKQPLKVAYTILIELLAFQFASPVQWIKTQEVLFSARRGRLIEIGPTSTLARMAERTLSQLRHRGKRWNLMCYARHRDAIYFNTDDGGPTAQDYALKMKAFKPKTEPDASAAATPAPAPSPAPSPAPARAPAPAPIPMPTAQPPAPATADAPVTAAEAIRVIVAVKVKKPVSSLDMGATLKDLVGGKSAMQNEIVGDLQEEFAAGSLPEGVSEMPLSQLSKEFPGYNTRGKVTIKMASRMLKSKMPGGFSESSLKSDLSSSFGLGPGRVEGVMLHMLGKEPKARLADSTACDQWLDDVVKDYCSSNGVSLSSGGGGGGDGAMMANLMAMMASGGGGGGGGGATLSDAPLTALPFLRFLVALKSKRSWDSVTAASSVKSTTGGKSAMQNEIVGDLQQEMGTDLPEGAAEFPLKDLAAAFPQYNTMGKFSQQQLSRLVGSRLPGGFGVSALKDYLSSERMLGPGRLQAVLLRAMVETPEKRLGSEQEAQSWIDGVADRYGKEEGVQVPRASAGGGGGGGGGGFNPAMLAMLASGGGGAGKSSDLQKALLTLLQDRHDAAQHFAANTGGANRPFAMSSYLRKQINDQKALQSELQDEVDLWNSEFGSDALDRIRPQFDPLKVRVYQSCWNWCALDCLDLYYCFATSMWSTEAALEYFATNKEIKKLTKKMTNRCTRFTQAMCTYFSTAAEGKGHVNIARGCRGLADVIDEMLTHKSVSTHNSSIDLTAPHVEITKSGKIEYTEVPRKGVLSMQDYVLEMRNGFMTAEAKANPLVSELEFNVSTNMDDFIAGGEDDGFGDGDGDKDGGDDDHIERALKMVKQQRPIQPESFAYKDKSFLGDSDMAISKLSSAKPKPTKSSARTSVNAETTTKPSIFIATSAHGSRVMDPHKTEIYFECLENIAIPGPGISFQGKVALATGCGKGSIAIEVVKALLEGGACVLVTTSSGFRSMKKIEFFRNIYTKHAGKGSKMYLLPFNGCSQTDTNNLVNYIFDYLKLDIDFVLPFSAMGEIANIGDLESKSEMAHRMMLTNVIRLLGQIKNAKQKRNIITRPCHVLLPLSPNHGTFGNDGMYAESKIGLEALLNKWWSEDWSDYLSIVGVIIGWTRGTGLMSENNIVAPALEEKFGLRTFSPAEMAFNIIALLHRRIVTLAQHAPLWADFGCSFASIDNLKEVTSKIRADIFDRARLQKTIVAERELERADIEGQPKAIVPQTVRSCFNSSFPKMPDPELLNSPALRQLRGAISLSKTVVVVGFGEVGPWGNSRTRWEMESYGTFSLEGCIELAWLMGLIKYHNGRMPSGEHYIGWLDTSTGMSVAQMDVKAKYEETITKHCGIRLLEPELFNGYQPSNKEFMQTVALDREMKPIEVGSKEEAESYRKRLGGKVEIWQRPSDGQYMMKLLRGAIVTIPRALSFDRYVAGQIPTGWDATRLGVPEDIVAQVDPCTLYALVATAEALMAAGVTDPYEFYKYVHVSELGNTSGGGLGGGDSLRQIFHDRKMDKQVQGDILQESFINTMPAWVNMLLLSSSGPIKTPVGACATAAESVAIGVETIRTGKAKIVVTGGYDDFQEEPSYEFAQMKATCNSEEEKARGRFPAEASRPTTSSRAGFVEAQGAGMQILMSAKVALEMGLPIYGIVGLANTATDKEGRSVPAPGRGILTTAREASHYTSTTGARIMPRMLDLSYRKRRLQRTLQHIEQCYQDELEEFQVELNAVQQQQQQKKNHPDRDAPDAGAEVTSSGDEVVKKEVSHDAAANIVSNIDRIDSMADMRAMAGSRVEKLKNSVDAEDPSQRSGLLSRDAGEVAASEADIEARIQMLKEETARLREAALEQWGNQFYVGDRSIAPLRGALAVWGLTVDSIGAVSFHGTSTKLNDINESAVTQKQMCHLGRTKGNPVMVICQKWLTGHPKGAAASWMLNGLLQVMNTGLVPGNRNADDIEPELAKNYHLVFPNHSIQTDGIDATLLKSFGFGQAGAEVLLIHPKFLFAAIGDDESLMRKYRAQLAEREARSFHHQQEILAGRTTVVRVKNSPPYSKAHEESVYLDPDARASFDFSQDRFVINPTTSTAQTSKADSPPHAPSVPDHASAAASAAAASATVGSDLRTKLEVAFRRRAEGVLRGSQMGIGVDVEPVSTFKNCSETMIARNFTKDEVAYCQSASSPASSFAGRWAAKEAVIKAMSNSDPSQANLWKGEAAALADIEITRSASGAPEVQLHGHAQLVAEALGIRKIQVSITHTNDMALALAQTS